MKNSPVKEMADGAKRLAEASRRRLAYFDISAAQIDDLERTGQVKKNLTLASPANGIVTKRMVTQGMYVQAGMPLLEVADLSTVWVDADIYQYELPWIKVGQPVTMTLDYLPGETFPGKIDYIYPYLKEATRTAKVRLRFSNPGLKLKPEMFAQVKIESPVSHQAVVVPVGRGDRHRPQTARVHRPGPGPLRTPGGQVGGPGRRRPAGGHLRPQRR